MTPEYVEKLETGYRIKGARVSLDSIVHAFLNGQSPQSIAEDFPVLTLEEVFGAIAYYLRNRAEINRHLREVDEQFPELQRKIRETYPLLNQKLDEARELKSAA